MGECTKPYKASEEVTCLWQLPTEVDPLVAQARRSCGQSKSILGLLSWLWLHWILLATSKVMGIMLGGFDRMGEGDSKKMQKLV